MPVTQKTYPEWVQQYRTRGKTVKKKGDSYYLYKRTSKRVPGKKYPQPDIEVWEYGFSKAVADLCPEGWKKPLGDEWEDILKIIICSWSETSYLQRGEIRSREEFRCQFNTQAASLSRRIWKEHKVEPKDLAPLKRIYLLKIGKENVISKIDPEQQEILDRLGLKLEV